MSPRPGQRKGMHFARTGSGRPLLLVHGLGGNRRSFQTILPALEATREVWAVELPGFGETPALAGEVTIAALTDAVQAFVAEHDLGDVDVVGSSMGARMALELARRGHGGTVVALDPGGFWNDREQAIFGTSVAASVKLLRALKPALPALAANPVSRTALLGQFSARPWALDGRAVAEELRSFTASPSFGPALDALRHGPKQLGAATIPGKVVIGWGRQDLVTLPRQAKRAQAAFPDARLHWFDRCGHLPHWDQPAAASELILAATA